MNWLTRWLAEGRESRCAVAAAVAHFEAATGTRANRSMCSVIAEAPDRSVVRVCYGGTRPQRRAWFCVPRHGAAPICEVSWEEAHGLGESAWR